MRFLPLLSVLLLSSTVLGQMGPAQVVVAPVQKQAIEISRPLVASVEPVTSTSVANEQEGVIIQRGFDEGQTVEQGAVLAEIDAELLKIQRDAAEAARLSAQSSLEQAQAEYEQAKRELERVRQLFEGNVAPEKEYLDRMTQERVAAAVVATQQANLSARKAEVDRLDIMIRKSTVRSPITAVVSARHIEVGQWIERGDAVADLVQLDPLYVRVNVPESLIAMVKKGDEARITFDALQGETLVGTIDQILPEADPSSRTFPVKILLPNPEQIVRPGFFARVVLVSSVEDSVTVPKDAVVTQGRESRVVVVRDGAAALVPVQLGPSDGVNVAVTGELKEGELVVIRGNEARRPGEPLMVQNPPQPATDASATQPSQQ